MIVALVLEQASVGDRLGLNDADTRHFVLKLRLLCAPDRVILRMQQ